MFILLTRDNQRLGDLVAGTLVLRERSGLAAPAPVSFAAPAGLEAYTATLDTSRLTIEEYQAVRTYLLRAASLPPGPRAALALQLADPLVARLRPPPPAGITPEQFLRCVGAAHQQRQRQATPGPLAPAPPPAGWQAPAPPAPPAPAPAPADAGDGGFAPPG
jgi:hypothetical protein